MAGGLHLKLFGNIAVHQNGVPVTDFRSNKARALLCYLATTGRPHTRPALAGLLWADMPEANALKNLTQALSNLRRLVGDHLTITRRSVSFDRESPYQIDVETFEAYVDRRHSTKPNIHRLQEAVKLYRGDFLEGFYVRDAPLFEEWALTQRARLRELALQTLHTLAVHYTQQGDAGRATAVDYTTRLLALEPWREEAHRQMMLLLALSGQRSAALAQYETCRQMLAEELGVEPGKETTMLYEQICHGDLNREALQPPPSSPIDPSLFQPADIPTFSSNRATAIEEPVFVAREQELARLNEHLNLTLAGQGRVAFVTGNPGCGKTALVQEFARRAQQRHCDLVVAVGNCNAHTGIGDPYLPFREILELLTGDVEDRLAVSAISQAHAHRLWNLMPFSIRALVEVGPDLIDIFISGSTLVAQAKAAASAGAPWITELQPLITARNAEQGQTRLTQAALFTQYAKVLQRLAGQKPLLLVIDDLQWADTGSISLLFHLGRRLNNHPVLVVGIYRPGDIAVSQEGERHPLEPVVNEFQRQFGDIQINLNQTRRREFVETFLETEPNRLGPAFRETLYRHSKGHALFTVEMLRGLQERGDLIRDEKGRWIENPTLDWETIPARIEGVIAERLERLPPTLLEVLKVAGVEGEFFTAEAIARVLNLEERQVIRNLSNTLGQKHRLVRAHQSERLGTQQISQYRFRHILFQKYLYERLDQAERSYLHEAVGNELERLHGKQADSIAARLARHFQSAGLTVKAINYLEKAGLQAVQSYANQEAFVFFNNALSLLNTLPDSRERAQKELDLQVAIGPILMAIKGYASSELEKTYTRARELCLQLEDTRHLFPILWGLWRSTAIGKKLSVARDLMEQLSTLAYQQQDTALILESHNAQTITLFYLGELVPAKEHARQAIDLYDLEQHHTLTFRFGQDPGVICHTFTALSLWLLGYPDQAVQQSCRAVDLAQADPFSLAYALHWANLPAQFCGERQVVQERAEKLMAFSSERNFPVWVAGGKILYGWALCEQDKNKQGVPLMQQGLAQWQSTGSQVFSPYYLALLAEAYGKVNLTQNGLDAIGAALDDIDKRGERWYEAELYRLRGELLWGRGEVAFKIETDFVRAIDIAQAQQVKSLELRAIMSLSRLWAQQEKKGQARRILADIYGWFTEGFETTDLKAAKTLLKTLT